MQNIVLTIHLILAVALILVVLLQRSEGGGLGIGGGGGGVVSGRSAATALSKLTWMLAVGFMITSISLVILSSRDAAGDSVIERLGVEDATGDVALPPTLDGDLTAPIPGDAPATPPKADE